MYRVVIATQHEIVPVADVTSYLNVTANGVTKTALLNIDHLYADFTEEEVPPGTYDVTVTMARADDTLIGSPLVVSAIFPVTTASSVVPTGITVVTL